MSCGQAGEKSVATEAEREHANETENECGCGVEIEHSGGIDHRRM